MTLNPFELLGVSVNSKSKDVRKRYYELACLAHPDRGGTDEQMITLHNAYKYVSDQVAHTNWTKTVEDCEEAFEAFSNKLKEEQKSTVASMYDITLEAFDLPKFNHEAFGNSETIDGPFLKGGYPTIASDLATEYDPTMKNSEEVAAYEGQIVTYTEPSSTPLPSHIKYLTVDGPLADYSCDLADLRPSDYKRALSNTPWLAEVIECNEVSKDDMLNTFERRRGYYGGYEPIFSGETSA